ncbi:MAG: hypothetical protein IJX80_04925 [Clostridia bacterium]|nr:hypothetical protein [Clostridia bacterium]
MDNYRNMEQGGARVQATLCDRQVVTELSSDFSLPDYQPEVKRLLRVRATVAPPDKYIGVGSAEFSGTVDYSILYAGNDGALYCASQTGEYQFNVPVEMTSDFEIGDGLICDVETVPDLTTGRVVAPRKLSLKCRLRSHVSLYGTRVLEEEINGAAPDSIQKLKGSVECARIFVGMGDPMQLGDEILFDAQSENLRVICADAQVYVTEAIAGSGCVNCRGEVCLKLICAHEGENEAPFVQLRRIPFTQSVPTDGAEVNCDCCANGVCSDIGITVEDGRILCEVTLRLESHAQRNERVEFTRDAYSTAAQGESRYADCRFPLALKCISGNFSLNTMLSMEEVGLRGGQTVVDLSLIPSVSELTCESGKYILTGRCRCHALLHSEEDLAAQEFEIPFRYETDGSEESVTDYDVNVTPISCRARADGERLAVDAELAVNIATRGECACRILTAASFDEAIARGGASYTVCYPSREDTLWTVAKRYHRSVSDIAEMNPLTGSPAADAKDSLAGVSYLLV